MLGWIGQEKYVGSHPADVFLTQTIYGIGAILALLLGAVVFFFYGIFWTLAAFLGFLLLTPLFVRITLKLYLDFLIYFAQRTQKKKMARD